MTVARAGVVEDEKLLVEPATTELEESGSNVDVVPAMRLVFPDLPKPVQLCTYAIVMATA
jgi:hypothetical protein